MRAAWRHAPKPVHPTPPISGAIPYQMQPGRSPDSSSSTSSAHLCIPARAPDWCQRSTSTIWTEPRNASTDRLIDASAFRFRRTGSPLDGTAAFPKDTRCTPWLGPSSERSDHMPQETGSPACPAGGHHHLQSCHPPLREDRRRRATTLLVD